MLPEKLIIFFIISLLIMIIVNRISFRFNLLDKPNYRKIHKHAIPYTGGVALAIIYTIFFKFFFYNEINSINNDLNLIIFSSMTMMVVGLIDDKYNPSVSIKLLLQFFPIFYLVFFSDLYLVDLGKYKFFTTELNNFAPFFTLGCIFLIINSTNYFDGLDGSLIFTFLTSISILIYLTYDNQHYKNFLICLSVPLFAFLFFNFRIFNFPKMFLGDSGSLMLGFILSFFLILVAKKNIVHPIILAWSISIFVYEFLTVNLSRIYFKKKIFNAGNDHIHYLIFKKTESKFLTNLFMISINFTLFIIGYSIFLYFDSFFSLISFIIFSLFI